MADKSQTITIQWNGTAIPGVVSISGPAPNNEPLDVTDLDDTSKAYLASVKDAGEIGLEINWEPDNAVHQAIVTDLEGGSARTVIITYPDATSSTWSLSCLATNFEPSAAYGEPLKASVTLRGTGAISR